MGTHKTFGVHSNTKMVFHQTPIWCKMQPTKFGVHCEHQIGVHCEHQIGVHCEHQIGVHTDTKFGVNLSN